MKIAKVSVLAAKAATKAVEKFVEREFPGFEVWLKDRWRRNPQAILVENPPNHVYDFADGSMNVSFGKRAVKRTLVHHEGCKGTVFAYSIEATGTLREVIEAIPKLSPKAQQEAAMAFYVEYSNNFVTNSPECQRLEGSFSNLPDGLDNPFYAGVCEAILTRFKELGWT